MFFQKGNKALAVSVLGLVFLGGVGTDVHAKQKDPPKKESSTSGGTVIYLPGFRVLIRSKPAPKPEPPIIDPIIVVPPPFW